MSKIRYGSVCSGIEAATVAWHPLGWEPQWFSEIEAFPSAVLAHRFPDVQNLGDMTKIHENETFKQSTIDLLVGGTPCQSFSVAGLRKGLDDPRGNLMLTFLAIAGCKRPRWVVWENVPGVLSSNGGRDFGTFLSGLAELGYGFAYRVLDAQYFGVAQRRRRVFVVGYLGDWRPAAAVLFERHSLSGHPAPSREKREGVASFAESSIGGYREDSVGGTLKASGGVLAGGSETFVATLGHTQSNGLGISQTETANTLEAVSSANQAVCFQQNTRDEVRYIGGDGQIDGALAAESGAKQTNYLMQPAHAFKVRGGCEGGGKGYLGQDEAAFTISTGQDQMVFDPNQITSKTNRSTPKPEISHTLPATSTPPIAFGIGEKPDISHCLRSGASKADKHESTTYVAHPIKETADCLTASYGTKWNGNASAENGSLFAKQGTAIRRLTPVECERLQGFPDGWTQIPYRNKPADQCPDGPRYKACGNSMAVPVMRWIGERINQVESILNQ